MTVLKMVLGSSYTDTGAVDVYFQNVMTGNQIDILGTITAQAKLEIRVDSMMGDRIWLGAYSADGVAATTMGNLFASAYDAEQGEGGSGAYSYKFDLSSQAAAVTLGGGPKADIILGGSGNDTVEFMNSYLGGDLTVDGGAGVNTMTVYSYNNTSITDSQFVNVANFAKFENKGQFGSTTLTLGANAALTFADGITITSTYSQAMTIDATAFTKTLTFVASDSKADTVKGTSASLNGGTFQNLGQTDTIIVTDQDLSALDNKRITSTLDLGSGRSMALTLSSATGDAGTGKAWSVAVANGASTLTLKDAPPGPSVSSITSSAASGKADSVSFTVTFSEAVNNVSADDFTLTAVSGTTTGTVGTPVTVDGGTTWTVAVSGLGGDGTVRLDLKNTGTGITSVAASADITGGFTSGGTYGFDTTAPTVTATVAAATNDTTPTVSVTTQDGSGVGVANGATVTIDVDLNNDGDFADGGETGHSTGTGATIDLNAIALPGTYRIQARVTDAAGNEGTSTPQTFVLDTTAPAAHGTTPITANDVAPAGSYGTGDTLTLAFSEAVAVAGVSVANLTVSGGHGLGTGATLLPVSAVEGRATSFTLTLGTGTTLAAGDTLSLAADKVVDAASNAAAATVSFTVPQLGPVATAITPADAKGAAAATSFTVTFSEAVSNVSTDDFILTAVSGATTGTVGTPVTVDGGTSWTVAVTGLTGDGTVRLDLKDTGTGITSVATSNAIAGGFTSGGTHTLDTTAPTITASVAALTNDTTPTVTVTTQDGTGVGVANNATVTIDVDLNNDGDFTDGGETGHSTGTGTTIDLGAIALPGTYRIQARVADAVGNQGTSAPQTFVLDTVKPVAHATTPITVDDVAPAGFYGAGDTLTLAFSEAVAVAGVSLANLAVSGGHSLGTGAALVPVAAVDGHAAGFTLTLGTGTTLAAGDTLSLAADKVVDAATNTAAATVSFTVPQLGPVAMSIAPATVAATATSVDYTVTFSEAVTGVGADDFTVTKTGSADGTVTGVTGSGTTYTVTVATQPDGQGTLRLDLNSTGTGIQDSGSRAIIGGFTTGQTHAMDRLAPQITGVAIADAPMKIGDTVTATITVASDADSFTLSSGTIGGFALGNLARTDATTYTASFTVAEGGTDVAAGDSLPVSLVLQDTAGNANSAYTTAISQATDAVDANRPTIAAASVRDARMVLTFSEAVTSSTAAGLSVTVNGVARPIASLSQETATTLTLTLDSAVTYGEAVLLDYSAAATGSNLVDAVGQEMADVTGRAVVNDTPPPAVPSSSTSTSSTVDGVTVQVGTAVMGDGATRRTVTIPVVSATRAETVGNNTAADVPLVENGAGVPLLTAQVPTGIGLEVSGTSAPKTAGTSVADLIQAIQARTVTGSAEQTRLTGGGSGFLANLAADTPLLVQTIVPTTGTGGPAEGPLVIAGTPRSAGNAQTALVIDTRSLPSGSAILLHNVDFATVIGAVQVTGGDGSQTVWGDASAQYIVLGADDDTLRGGGGNDFVGSAEGDDVLFGDEGDDTVAGGVGNDALYGNLDADLLHGNAGTDTLFGGQDADTAFGGLDGDAVYGQLGSDLLYGNKGSDTLFGGQSDDTLFGGQDDDVLHGGRGDDVLAGNAGSDTLHGGTGADVFRLDGAGSGVDVIADFEAGTDRIAVVGPNFGAIPAGTLSAANFALDNPAGAGPAFVFDTHTGALSFDADGAGVGAAVTIATLNVRTLEAGDITVLAA